MISRQSDVGAHQRGTAKEAESWKKKGNVLDVFAEQGDEVDRAGMTAFRDLPSLQPARHLISVGSAAEVLVNDPLRYLILEAWEHDHLSGSETDLALQSHLRAEWTATLTVEDCVAMARWLSDPVVPEDWGIGTGWHETLASGLSYYVGRAGRRLDDPRARDAVIDLIRRPSSRRLGLECAQELKSSEVFKELLPFLGEQKHPADVSLALAASATPGQVEELRQLATSATLSPDVRATVKDAIAEWEMMPQEK